MIRSTDEFELRSVIETEQGRMRTIAFLTHIFHLFPPHKFFELLRTVSQSTTTESECYVQVQKGLPSIKPFLAELTLSLPSLMKQKREMTRQTLQIPGFPATINGYVEIGSPGRYISRLQKNCSIAGDIVLVNETEPSFSPVDIAERGGLRKIGRWMPLRYDGTLLKGVGDTSIDVLTIYIGLHHAPVQNLPLILEEVCRVLRQGGLFVIRDHDVRSMEMATFVSFAHTVFNIGTAVPVDVQQADVKVFRSADEWSATICKHGFEDLGVRVLQENDPTDNTLMAFRKM